MKPRTAKKLVEQEQTLKEVFVGTTPDGCFLDMGEGENRVRIEMPFMQGIDVVAAMIVAMGPAAGRHGISPDAYMNKVEEAIHRKMVEGIAAERQARKAGSS